MLGSFSRISGKRGNTTGNVFLLTAFFVIVAFIALFAYGQYWPRKFQARVPWTNMRDVERAVGRPLHVSTNSEGVVEWDYTTWWSGRAEVYFNTNGNYVRTFTEW
jgi:hypothetical protein